MAGNIEKLIVFFLFTGAVILDKLTPIAENQEAGWALRIVAGDSAAEQELLLFLAQDH